MALDATHHATDATHHATDATHHSTSCLVICGSIEGPLWHKDWRFQPDTTCGLEDVEILLSWACSREGISQCLSVMSSIQNATVTFQQHPKSHRSRPWLGRLLDKLIHPPLASYRPESTALRCGQPQYKLMNAIPAVSMNEMLRQECIYLRRVHSRPNSHNPRSCHPMS